MKYELGDEIVHIYPFLLKRIGSGKEGKVYKFGDRALKILHDVPYQKSMNSTTCGGLEKIATKRILLPRETLFDKSGEFKGYSTRYIKYGKDVFDISKENFLYEVNELIKEINFLSNQRIIIDDWRLENFIYDGKFRLVDPGLYRYEKEASIDAIKKLNFAVLKDFVFFELLKSGLMAETNEYVDYLLDVHNTVENDIVEYFEDEMKDDETMNQYIKRIAKK